MSIATHVAAAPSFAQAPFASEPSRQQAKPQMERRQPSPSQGRALELLGHAIEYLVDSRLYQTWDTPTDAEAVHRLMACSRAVFADCDVVVSWQQRLHRAARRRLHIHPSITH